MSLAVKFKGAVFDSLNPASNLSVPSARQHGLAKVLTIEQATKETGHFSGADVPCAVPNSVLSQLPLERCIAGKCFVNQSDEFFDRSVDSHARRLQVLVKGSNDDGLAGCEVFTDLNCASVAGTRVFLVPRQYTHINVAIVAGEGGKKPGGGKMYVRRGHLDYIRVRTD